MTENQYLSKYFTILANPKLYSTLLYLALAFPLGLIYFIFLVVGFSVGIPLIIIWVGLIILALIFPLIWLILKFERAQARILLNVSLPFNEPPSLETQSILTKIKAFMLDPATWRGLLFIILKFPIGLLSFIALITGFAIITAFIFAPIAIQIGNINLGFWHVDTISEAIGLSLIGIMLLPGFCHLYFLLGKLLGAFSAYLLKPKN